jgi:peptidoglycan/LPS O-acetylase OafA/YrhL
VEFDLLALLTAWAAAYAVFSVGILARGWRWPTTLVGIGKISYSLYLIHPLVLVWLPPGPAWIYMPAFFALTLALAMVTYNLVERPCINLGRRLERHAPVVAQPVAATMRRAA